MDWLFDGLSDDELAFLSQRFVEMADAYSALFDAICAEALARA